jgi:hypothetical protein
MMGAGIAYVNAKAGIRSCFKDMSVKSGEWKRLY